MKRNNEKQYNQAKTLCKSIFFRQKLTQPSYYQFEETTTSLMQIRDRQI